MTLAGRPCSHPHVLIPNQRLIEMVLPEVPNIVFFDTKIVRRVVIIWRIGIYRLALNIVELKLFVRVFHRNDR